MVDGLTVVMWLIGVGVDGVDGFLWFSGLMSFFFSHRFCLNELRLTHAVLKQKVHKSANVVSIRG